jgi:glycosyltransferase involved in cell wall biosynthesis
MRVLFLASGLHYGGAERQIVELARRLDRSRFTPLLCALDGVDTLAQGCPDIPVLPLKKRHKYDVALVSRARRLLREHRIDLVHSFLFDAEMVGRLAGRWARVGAIVASERNSGYAPRGVKDLLLRLTGGCFDLMIANSEAGKQYNIARLGVAPDRIRVIYNGVESERFRPHDVSGVRGAAGIPEDGPLVGMFASFKAQKNHEMFVRVIERVSSQVPGARFLFVAHQPPGDPVAEARRQQIEAALEATGARARCHFLLDRPDVEDLYAICALTVLTSDREGVPNVVLESMSTGVPVVATDVADNRLIIREGVSGHVVAPNDDAAMADRVVALLTNEDRRRALGEGARREAVTRFSPDLLARLTEAVYLQALERRGQTRELRGDV